MSLHCKILQYNIAEHWNLEFKIHFPVFLDRSNKLDMALTEYLYIKLLSFLHNDSYHVIQYALLNTVKHFFSVGFN
jgi:hypothetical protein